MAGRSREGLYAIEFANAPVVESAQILEVRQSRSRWAEGWWWVRRG